MNALDAGDGSRSSGHPPVDPDDARAWQTPRMRSQLDIVTLGVPDLEAARRFYRDGLGWEPQTDLGEIVFFQVGHGRLIALFGAQALEADIGGSDAGTPAVGSPGAGMTLAQIVDTEEEVSAVLERAAGAGGAILKPPQWAEFGGFHGYFADPAGFRWEIATNPGWSVAADGRVVIEPIEPREGA